MPHYMISYDLHKQRSYQALLDLLRKWIATKALESVWLLTTTLEAGQVRDAIHGAVDDDDSIVVLELKSGSNWATRHAPAAAQWLSANILKSN